MHYEDLESWQLEELANCVHEMVGFFTRLKRRMDQKQFANYRFREVVTAAANGCHTLWVHLHYASCDAARRERGKFGERKKKPRRFPLSDPKFNEQHEYV